MNALFLPFTLVSAFMAVSVSLSLAAPEPPIPAYFAKATVEISPIGNDPEQRLRAHLPKNDPSVTITGVRNTGLFEIGVTDSDPKLAAERANEIAMAVKSALSNNNDPRILKIWEKAEPPISPMAPKK